MRSPPIAFAVLVASLLLTGALAPAAPASGAVPLHVSVLFDFGEGRWQWAAADLSADTGNAWCATLVAAASAGLTLDYTVSTYGVLLKGVDGVAGPRDFSTFWGLLGWNATSSRWRSSELGAGSLAVKDGDAIAWRFGAWGDPAPAPTPTSKEPWTSFRGGSPLAGAAPAGPAAGGTVWAANLSAGPVDATPIVADGRAFFVTGGVYDWGGSKWVTRPAVVALDATTGKELWRRPFDGKQGFEILTPAYRGGTLYVATSLGHLMAIDAAKGELRWDRSGMGSSSVAAPFIPGGAVVSAAISGLSSLKDVAGSAEEGWCTTLAGGALFARPSVPAPVVYMAQPIVIGGRVYIGTEFGSLHALNLSDGKILWSAWLGGRVRGTVLVDSDRLYATSSQYEGLSAVNGSLYCLDLDGKVLWNASLPPTASSPARLGDLVVVGSSAGLHAFKLDGKPAWSYLSSGPVSSSPAVAGDRCYFVTNINNATAGLFSSLVVVDGRGRRVWARTLEPHDWALASVAIADSRAYVASDNGWAYCLGDSPLVANFTFEVHGDRATFADTTDRSSSPLANWTWDLGDGSAGAGPSVVHVYKRSGQYNVTLTVVDVFGRKAIASQQVTVEVHKEKGFIPGCGPAAALLAVAAATVLVWGGPSRRGSRGS
jgi:outer membrane protein assembly factor BamB